MNKLAAVAAATLALTLALPSKPAAASRCSSHCSPLFDAMSWTIAAGLIGGYAYGTGYFIYRDATDATQSPEYGGAELAANGTFGFLLSLATVDAVRHRKPGSAVAYGAFSALHLTLAAHGGWRIYDRRDDIHVSSTTLQRAAGLAYGTNTLLWALQVPERHGRGYGVAEAAVNAPLAAGLGYLAYDAHRHRQHRTGKLALYGSMTAISGALAIHGLYTALAPRPVDRFEVLGADLAPTVVTDGREVAPGLGASGTW